MLHTTGVTQCTRGWQLLWNDICDAAAHLCGFNTHQPLSWRKAFCNIVTRITVAGGYMLAAATTTKYAFDLRPGDVYWCATTPVLAGDMRVPAGCTCIISLLRLPACCDHFCRLQ